MDAAKPVIAIVDDDPSVCRALARLIRTFGYVATTYGSAEAFLADPKSTEVSHILMDLHLPKMQGDEALLILQSGPTPPRIIVMTGRDRPGDRQHCFEAGAYAYILKPVESESLGGWLGLPITSDNPST